MVYEADERRKSMIARAEAGRSASEQGMAGSEDDGDESETVVISDSSDDVSVRAIVWATCERIILHVACLSGYGFPQGCQ